VRHLLLSRVVGDRTSAVRRERTMLTIGMVILGLAAFAAMAGFIALCDHV
jgi:hypothetical protein